MKHLIKLSALALSVVLIGCGGGSGSGLGGGGYGGAGDGSGSGGGGGSPTTSSTGTLSLTINWPQATRLIPAATQCIKISVYWVYGGLKEAEKTVLRSRPDVYTDSVLFTSLHTGDTRVEATAYPSPNATGTPQATAFFIVSIPENQTVTKELTMSSTIWNVVLSPKNPSVKVGETITVTASALDANGNVVLTAPFNWDWHLTDSSRNYAELTPNGDTATIKGLQATSVLVGLTVTEKESGMSGFFWVNVEASDNGGGGGGGSGGGSGSGGGVNPGPPIGYWDANHYRILGLGDYWRFAFLVREFRWINGYLHEISPPDPDFVEALSLRDKSQDVNFYQDSGFGNGWPHRLDIYEIVSYWNGRVDNFPMEEYQLPSGRLIGDIEVPDFIGIGATLRLSKSNPAFYVRAAEEYLGINTWYAETDPFTLNGYPMLANCNFATSTGEIQRTVAVVTSDDTFFTVTEYLRDVALRSAFVPPKPLVPKRHRAVGNYSPASAAKAVAEYFSR